MEFMYIGNEKRACVYEYRVTSRVVGNSEVGNKRLPGNLEGHRSEVSSGKTQCSQAQWR
jgi:hypothetical protein